VSKPSGYALPLDDNNLRDEYGRLHRDHLLQLVAGNENPVRKI
jgi:hypothetical protein